MDEIARQCTAHNRIGERCQKSAMRGQQVCHFHGGKNPNALRVAKERLLALAEPALDGLTLRESPPIDPPDGIETTYKGIYTNNFDERPEVTSGAPGAVGTVAETVTAERPPDLTREIT